MFSSDAKYFALSKLSIDETEEIVFSGSSSSSEDDRRAAALSSGSFADSVGLLPALPETSSSSDFSESLDDDSCDSGTNNSKSKKSPSRTEAENRFAKLGLRALNMLSSAKQKTQENEPIMKNVKMTRSKSDPQDVHDMADWSMDTILPSCKESTTLNKKNGTVDSSSRSLKNSQVFLGMSVLPAVMEEEDEFHSNNEIDGFNKFTKTTMDKSVCDGIDVGGNSSIASSRDSYSFSSSGSRSRTKVERKKKKKSSRVYGSSSSCNYDPNSVSLIEGMEKELHARLQVILQLKDTIVKQHDMMKRSAKENIKLKTKLRIVSKSLKTVQKGRNEDMEHVLNLENELKSLRIELDHAKSKIHEMAIKNECPSSAIFKDTKAPLVDEEMETANNLIAVDGMKIDEMLSQESGSTVNEIIASCYQPPDETAIADKEAVDGDRSEHIKSILSYSEDVAQNCSTVLQTDLKEHSSNELVIISHLRTINDHSDSQIMNASLDSLISPNDEICSTSTILCNADRKTSDRSRAFLFKISLNKNRIR